MRQRCRNYACEEGETVHQLRAETSAARESICRSYLYKYVYLDDDYHRHYLLLLHYINYLFNDN